MPLGQSLSYRCYIQNLIFKFYTLIKINIKLLNVNYPIKIKGGGGVKPHIKQVF